jgi:hypothetical protein
MKRNIKHSARNFSEVMVLDRVPMGVVQIPNQVTRAMMMTKIRKEVVRMQLKLLTTRKQIWWLCEEQFI